MLAFQAEWRYANLYIKSSFNKEKGERPLADVGVSQKNATFNNSHYLSIPMDIQKTFFA